MVFEGVSDLGLLYSLQWNGPKDNTVTSLLNIMDLSVITKRNQFPHLVGVNSPVCRSWQVIGALCKGTD